MIDANAVWERVNQLAAERDKLAEQLQQGAAELERTRHLISAYDGAIGELRRLALLAGDGPAMTPEETAA